MKKCRSENGRIPFIRNAADNVRYFGKCDDCGYATEPMSLNAAVFELDVHYGKKVFK